MSLVQEVISFSLPEGEYAAQQRIQAFQLVAEDCGGSVKKFDRVSGDNIAILRIGFSLGEVPARFVKIIEDAGATRMMPQPA